MMRRRSCMAAVLLAVCLTGCAATATRQEPESQPAYESLYGKIKTVNGNEIVLAVMEVGASAAGGAPGGGENGGMPADAAQSGAQSAQRQGARDAGADFPGRRQAAPDGEGTGTRPAAGEEGGMAGAPGTEDMEGAPADQTDVQSGLAYRLTGEERTYLIPMTARITIGRGDGERSLRFTQLAYKNVVELSFDADGVIVKVQVLE